MPLIELQLEIDAPRQRVFDLARSIDLHSCSVGNTEERAIAGVTSGLIGSGEEVTWSARHLGVRQTLTSRITRFDAPHHFRDSMVRGAFSRLDHDHFFEALGEKTRMIDRFDFDSPGWVFGKMFNALFLTGYLREFLVNRNLFIKQAAETDLWRKFLPADSGASKQ
ncbi:MAG: SRPBCC family protein [Verrucomicrobiota bacterium]